jgi:hypothetical protein
LASSLVEKRLLDVKLNLLNSRSQLQTATEVSINEGEAAKLVDSVLLTVPTSIRYAPSPSPLFSPQHIFPFRRTTDIAQTLPPASREYLSRLLADSSRSSSPDVLLRWYDLNLLLALLEEVEEGILSQLVDHLRSDLIAGRAPSDSFLILVDSLRAIFS